MQGDLRWAAANSPRAVSGKLKERSLQRGRSGGMEGYQRITAEMKEPEMPVILCLHPCSFSVSSLTTQVIIHRGVTLGSW